jgi:hypothetical protein
VCPHCLAANIKPVEWQQWRRNMESYLACGSELGATAAEGYTQLTNNMEKDMLLRVEAKLSASNPINTNLQVVEDQVYRSHPLARRRRHLFKYRRRGNGEPNTDFLKAMMMQAKEAELENMSANEMVIYLTLDKISDVELVRKWYVKAPPAVGVVAEAKMDNLVDLTEELEALEASIEVHTKKGPKLQKENARTVNTDPPKRNQSRGRESVTCYRCGLVGHFRSECKETKVFCSKCDSSNHATSVCRKEPAGKTEDKKKDKKEKQRESTKTKEEDKKANEKKKEAKKENHKARKITPKRRKKVYVSESSSDSSESYDSSESESTLRVEVRCSPLSPVNISSNATPRMDCFIKKMNSRHKHSFRPLPEYIPP